MGRNGIDEGSVGATPSGDKAMSQKRTFIEATQELSAATSQIALILFPWLYAFVDWLNAKLDRHKEP
jgi:hypothetical protein